MLPIELIYHCETYAKIGELFVEYIQFFTELYIHMQSSDNNKKREIVQVYNTHTLSHHYSQEASSVSNMTHKYSKISSYQKEGLPKYSTCYIAVVCFSRRSTKNSVLQASKQSHLANGLQNQTFPNRKAELFGGGKKVCVTYKCKIRGTDRKAGGLH